MRLIFHMVVIATAVLMPAAASAAPASTPSQPIEAAYDHAGPYQTTIDTATDDQGHQFVVYRPTDYATLGFASPILSWGNGTGTTPNKYATLLTHLATYGFTVIASTAPNTGSGREIDAAAAYLIAQQSSPDGSYFGHLDTAHVGVLGNSQGAAGAVNAATHNPSRYGAVMTFSLPAQPLATPNPDCLLAIDCTPHPDQLHTPTFLLGTHGPFDALTCSPATQAAYFHSIPAPAVLGLVARGTDHASIQDGQDPGAETGYATAWFLSQLRGDAAAGEAFTGAHPELTGNPDWPGSLTK